MGAARSQGYTARAAHRLARDLALDEDQVIDLRSRRLEPFDYRPAPAEDDFRAIVEQMARHPHIVFATPVYWYAMSAVMKLFFDRFTDLLLHPENRALGRSLAGRDVWLMATGTDEELPPGFEEPFARTARYFGMHWREAFYLQVDTVDLPADHDLSAVNGLVAALRR